MEKEKQHEMEMDKEKKKENEKEGLEKKRWIIVVEPVLTAISRRDFYG